MTQENDTLGEKALEVAARNPANISFLIKGITIAIVASCVLISFGTSIIAGGAAKKYILSKIETCDAK
jgi:hypothetical protein